MSLDTDPHALAGAFLPLMFRVVRRLKRQAISFGKLNPVDGMILGALMQKPGRGVSELAADEGISGPTMSEHVKRLEAAGWIAREVDPGDRRRVNLAVTEAGRRLLNEVFQEGNDWLAGWLADLSADDRAAIAAAIGPLTALAGESR